MRWKYETARERASLPGSGWSIVGIWWMDVLVAPGLQNVPAPGVGGGCRVELPESKGFGTLKRAASASSGASGRRSWTLGAMTTLAGFTPTAAQVLLSTRNLAVGVAPELMLLVSLWTLALTSPPWTWTSCRLRPSGTLSSRTSVQLRSLCTSGWRKCSAGRGLSEKLC